MGVDECELRRVYRHSDTFSDHEHCERENLMFLIFDAKSCRHSYKWSCDFMGGPSPDSGGSKHCGNFKIGNIAQ